MSCTGDDLTAAGVSPSTQADRGPLWAPWRALARKLEAQVEEIRADPVLRIYGAALALLISSLCTTGASRARRP